MGSARTCAADLRWLMLSHRPSVATMMRHPPCVSCTCFIFGSGDTPLPESKSPRARDTARPPGHRRSGPTPGSPAWQGPRRSKPSGATRSPLSRTRATSLSLVAKR
eukprot:356701-Chlamydomonas_euryale.AAC.11